jgi:branched-chain amino acid transport system permease protein
MLAQQIVNAISLGGVYALFALGFTLIFGVLNVVNLAHGAIFMLGAYAALQTVLQLGLPLLASVFVAMLVTGAAGWLVDYLIFAPLRLRKAPHLAPMIATIGLAIVLTSLVEGYFGPGNLRFPLEVLPVETMSIGAAQITSLEVRIIFLAFLIMCLLVWGLN